jgi:FkbM family methyltransferase
MKTYFKSVINAILGKTFGVKLYSTRVHGKEDMADINNTGYKVSTIFDVGANIGQSATKFRKAFPDSTIYCFEPVKYIFEKLERNLSKDINTKLYPVAMGKNQGVAQIFITEHETTCSIVEPEHHIRTETVTVDTVDNFNHEFDIQRIDLLKIDAEGFDIDVLKGADMMLSSGKIGFVLVEVGFHPKDSRHVLFDYIRDYLVEREFFLFGIYDQQLEWSGENRLRYANACFLRELPR